MPEIAVGIDLGTSNACVAVSRQRRVEVLRNAYGEPVSASVVAFREDGDVVVGNAARANIIHDPTHTVCSAKRLIGRYFFSEEVRKAQAICAYEIVEGQNHSVRVKVRDELFSLPEISAMVLKEMKSVAEAALGQPISKAVITVPAYFNDNQRQATRDAGRIAGLEVLRLLNEPTAAALAYGFGRGLSQKVAVYDLGGGTFDISVLQIGKDVFEVLSTCGDTFLGGDDFDDRLIDMLAEDFLAHEGINLRKDPFALEKLKVAAEAAKKGFSMDDEVEIRIPDVVEGPDGQPRSIVRRLAESEFSGLVQDLLQRTFKVCDEALAEAGLVASDLDGVILVGGPTRLHALRRAVADYFGQEPKVDVDPDEAVAMGAAIHASSLVGSDVDSVLLDVTPLSLKIGVAGGLAETVIERNTPVPIEQTRTFTTFQDYQESVRIQVFQGESRSVEENEQLGQFTFSGFRRAARGQVRIQVTFEIDTDGIVNVTALDPETGQQASTQITLSSGLSPEELDRILQERKTDRVRTAGADEARGDTAPGPGGARAAAARARGARCSAAHRGSGFHATSGAPAGAGSAHARHAHSPGPFGPAAVDAGGRRGRARGTPGRQLPGSGARRPPARRRQPVVSAAGLRRARARRSRGGSGVGRARAHARGRRPRRADGPGPGAGGPARERAAQEPVRRCGRGSRGAGDRGLEAWPRLLPRSASSRRSSTSSITTICSPWTGALRPRECARRTTPCRDASIPTPSRVSIPGCAAAWSASPSA
jgi:molecular chaperone DnaK